jgi:hypothetical protein
MMKKIREGLHQREQRGAQGTADVLGSGAEEVHMHRPQTTGDEPGIYDYAARAEYFAAIAPEQRPDAPDEAERCLRMLIRQSMTARQNAAITVKLALLIGRDISRRCEAFDLLEPLVRANPMVGTHEDIDACLMLAADPQRRPLAIASLRSMCAAVQGPWSTPFAVASRILAEDPSTREQARILLENVPWSPETGAVDAIHAAAAASLCGGTTCWMAFPRLEVLLEHGGPDEWSTDAALMSYIHQVHPHAEKALAHLRRCIGSPKRPWFVSYQPHIQAMPAHPHAEWLPILADVCRGDAKPDLLDNWSEWQATA